MARGYPPTARVTPGRALAGGRPAPAPASPSPAPRAGLGLQEAVAGVRGGREDWPRFGVGVNTGPALVGNIGAEQMRNFTAIGDTTNLAARLQSLAEPGQVVVGQRTAEELGRRARVEARSPVLVKGKREPVPAYVLHGLADAPASGGSVPDGVRG